ncbi:uncharacterized protein [Elaeis guineensis]|uniref:uncharacterized protein isoform X1 n=1 Tax=Elaeis guineensis var. tenera TaxID=51953 RepID=UPI003C6D9680
MPYPNQVLEVVRPIQRLLTAKKQQSVDWWFDEGGTFNFDEEGHCLEAVFQWIEDHNTGEKIFSLLDICFFICYLASTCLRSLSDVFCSLTVVLKETRLSNIIAALQYQRFTKTITRCLGFSGD